MNVLILSGGGFQGQTILKELSVISGLEIYIADIYPENTNKYFTAQYHIFPPVNDASFSAYLKKFISEKKIRLIIPATAYELRTLSKLSHELECHVAVSSVNVLEIFGDKKRTYEYLYSNGFPIASTFSYSEASEEKLPLIAKSITGFGGKGISVIRTADEWALWKKQNATGNFVLQEYIDNTIEYSADFVIGFNKEVSEINLRTRLRQSGGFATVMDLVRDRHLSNLVRSFASKIASEGAQGFFNVQLLQKKDRIVFSDINPRMGTSAVVGEMHGNNLCAFLLEGLGIRHEYTIDERPKKTIRYLTEKFIPLKTQNVKAVVFDLDDTLMPQKKWILGKLDMLYDHVQPDLPKAGWMAEGLHHLENGHRADLLDKLIETFRLPSSMKQEMIEEYRKLIPEAVIYSDVTPVLKKLKQEGILTAILTDNPPSSQEQKLRASGLHDHFDTIVYTRNAGGEKPYIGGFDSVRRQLNVKTEEIVYIGDHLYKDILGAYLAGYRSLFWIQREGGFFNFDEKAFRQLHPAIEFAKVEDLFSISAFVCD